MADGNCGTPMTDIKNDDDESSDDDDDDDDETQENKCKDGEVLMADGIVEHQ